MKSRRRDQPKPATRKRGRRQINTAKEAEVMALALSGQSGRSIAKMAGLNRETVARILSQQEHNVLLQTFRSMVMEKAVPLAFKKLMKLLNKGSERPVLETLCGAKVLLRHHEVDMSVKPADRDYSSAMVRFYYEYGRWPTRQEATMSSPITPVFSCASAVVHT